MFSTRSSHDTWLFLETTPTPQCPRFWPNSESLFSNYEVPCVGAAPCVDEEPDYTTQHPHLRNNIRVMNSRLKPNILFPLV